MSPLGLLIEMRYNDAELWPGVFVCLPYIPGFEPVTLRWRLRQAVRKVHLRHKDTIYDFLKEVSPAQQLWDIYLSVEL